MQPNYNELVKKQQQDYQATRDPFAYGNQVAKRRYSEIMAGLQQQKLSTAQSYSDMYQAARQTAVGERAMGGPSLSGGMKAQYSDLVSAREMQQLSQIGGARERAIRDLQLQEQSAFSNAQLEGQQATQLRLQDQQTKLELVRQKQAILADKDLTEEQKNEQLIALGIDPATTQKPIPKEVSPIWGVAGGIAGALISAGVVKGIAGAAAGAGFLGKAGGFIIGAGKLLLPVLGWAGVIAGVAYTAEKVFELVQGKGSEGGFIGEQGIITNWWENRNK